ncbi:hypothetical protein FEM48_Zijuj03G0095000 [Ziziphus jujuba var. spinosa]|uniref:PB1-like domain-containing protein n=1 Tax=Ziziphus jujuba var. spinosa TaxID=714518 RepID=A0A978VPI3_ZIZJJ|nr:hypothetical protein FEM48_Zijuj03G0095000 [Ziziphus jujuba var. spinosa]
MSGKLSHFDNCNLDKWSIIVLAETVKELGYNRFKKLWYLSSGTYSEFRLRPIEFDDDTMDIVDLEDDDGLQECATLTDSLVVYSSNGVYDFDQLVSLPSSSDDDEVLTYIIVYSIWGSNLENNVKQDLIVDITESQVYRARAKANAKAAGDVVE